MPVNDKKILWHMKVTVMPIVIGALGMLSSGMEKGSRAVGNRRKNPDHSDCNMGKIARNTEKSPDETLCDPNSGEKTPAKTCMKNFPEVK